MRKVACKCIFSSVCIIIVIEFNIHALCTQTNFPVLPQKGSEHIIMGHLKKNFSLNVTADMKNDNKQDALLFQIRGSDVAVDQVWLVLHHVLLEHLLSFSVLNQELKLF